MAELNMDQKIRVQNLSNVPTYFRCLDRPVDAKIPSNGSVLFTISEILNQVNAGNPEFVGTDGKGAHAGLYITEKYVRVAAGFELENDGKKQEIFDEEAIIALFKENNPEKFYKSLKNKIVSIGEKETLKAILDAGKVNEHNKVEIAQKYLNGENVEFPKNNQ